MDRQIVYPGAIPLETDLLNTNKNMMIGLAKLAAAVLGTSTMVNGFAVTPTSPASMQVNVAAGEIYALSNIDGTAYSSLSADTTHSILKQGIALDAQLLTLTVPVTSGQSINYLIQAAYQDQDAVPVLLPYYNSANPSQPWSGPNNSGSTQYTARKGIAVVSAKAGIAAPTGSQTTPAPDAGYVGLYVVTVANGQATITAGNISQYSGASLLPSGLLQSIQTGNVSFGTDTGTANAYLVNCTPALQSRAEGQVIRFKAKTGNNGACTLWDGVGTSPLVGGAHAALQGGEIVANGDAWAQWNSSVGGSGSYILLFCTGAPEQVANATQSQHAVPLGQVQSLIAAAGYKSGTLLMWPTPVAPSWALVRDGSAITRSTYANLFAALCPTRTGTLTSGQNSVTGLSSTSDLWVGMPVEAAGMPAGATIAGIPSATSITLSANATANGAQPITLFYWGYGTSGSATTFGLPDDRGLFERGLDAGARGYDLTNVTGTTHSNNVVDGLASTKGMFVGMAIAGPGIPGSTTVASIPSATSITISQNATASATVTLTVTGRQFGYEQADDLRSHKHNVTVTGGSAGPAQVSSYSAGGTSNTDSTSIQATGGNETRPRNRAYLPIIVY